MKRFLQNSRDHFVFVGAEASTSTWRRLHYHMFANGDDAKNFITDEKEFKAAFNRFALCQYLTGTTVLSFSIEDTHPHSLLYGSYERCRAFADMYVDLSIRSVVQKRGSKDGRPEFNSPSVL